MRTNTANTGNGDTVTLTMKRNQARLLVPALFDRMVMLSADRAEGRTTDAAHQMAWQAHVDLVKLIQDTIN